jgi:hypothetical protein
MKEVLKSLYHLTRQGALEILRLLHQYGPRSRAELALELPEMSSRRDWHINIEQALKHLERGGWVIFDGERYASQAELIYQDCLKHFDLKAGEMPMRFDRYGLWLEVGRWARHKEPEKTAAYLKRDEPPPGTSYITRAFYELGILAEG